MAFSSCVYIFVSAEDGSVHVMRPHFWSNPSIILNPSEVEEAIRTAYAKVNNVTRCVYC